MFKLKLELSDEVLENIFANNVSVEMRKIEWEDIPGDSQWLATKYTSVHAVSYEFCGMLTTAFVFDTADRNCVAAGLITVW